MRKAVILVAVVFFTVALFAGVGAARVINGGNGSDTLNGTPRADTINGGNGPDLLRGFQGDDELNGGSGKDRCRGGRGTDTFQSCEIKADL
jgi:Ca2+-binding RTX toxin-like protein